MKETQVSQETLKAKLAEIVQTLKTHQDVKTVEGPLGLYELDGSTMMIADTYTLLSVVDPKTYTLLYQVVHYRDLDSVEFIPIVDTATVFDFFNFGQ